MNVHEIALLVLAAALSLTAQRAQAATLYVATSGNDAWSGRLAAPDAGRTDGPLATLQGARDAVRRLTAHGKQNEPIHVVIDDGVYRVATAVEFLPEDSGTPSAPVTYTARPGAHPTISGGRPITGWNKGEGPLWQAEVPADPVPQKYLP